MQLMLHNIMPSSFTNSFTAKAVPYMLSSVLTDVMQMLPSAANSHTESNKYQYMFVEKPLYNMPFLQNYIYFKFRIHVLIYNS